MKIKQHLYSFLQIVASNYMLQTIYYNFLGDKKPIYLFPKIDVPLENDNNLIFVYTCIVLLFAIVLLQLHKTNFLKKVKKLP